MTCFKNTKVAALLILFCSTLQASSENISADSVLAEVNGKTITLAHVIAAVARLPQEYNNLETDYLLEGVLDQIVKQELMAQTLDVSGKLIEASMENEIRSIRAKYAIEEQMKGFPTPEIIQTAYEEVTLSIETVEEFNASHILLNTEKKAMEVIELLQSGVEFSQLAQEKSKGPSAPNGGQLGWFGLGQMVPEFETAVMVLEVGKVSQPVKTQFGWHIIKLNDRRSKPLPSLEDLKPELVQKLSQNRIDELIRNKTETATIQLYDQNIDSSLIRDLNLLSSDESKK